MDRNFSLADIITFEQLVAPKVLKVIYWLGNLGIVIMMLVSMAGAFSVMDYSFATGLGTLLLALLGGLFGVLVWRVVIEMYIVFFGIYERLGDIREALRKG